MYLLFYYPLIKFSLSCQLLSCVRVPFFRSIKWGALLRYATELLKSEYCLHFRGDTTTSRRVYDAIAAGCVPVIVSDNTHVPFTSSINWNAFTVAIPERALLQVPLNYGDNRLCCVLIVHYRRARTYSQTFCASHFFAALP